MTAFSISNSNSVTLTDTSPGTGAVIDFTRLDNSFSIQINGVDLFVGGPAGAPNMAEFQIARTSGQTVRFADGDQYALDTPEVYQLSNTGSAPVVRLEINPDGTIALYGIKANDGTLEPLELFNGLTVNSAAISAAWNDTGSNTIVIDQNVTGPTYALGNFDPLCFASGTMIDTATGPRRIEELKVGDRVFTYDDGEQPIRWIGSCHVSAGRLADQPRLHPILIRADALGPGIPARDLTVSPQHRMLVCSAIAGRIFGQTEILIPANKLLPLPGVSRADPCADGVRYLHLMFDRHQVIRANGTPAESLFPGSLAIAAATADAQAELKELFPELFAPGFTPVAARPIPEKGHQIRRLVARHIANQKPLLQTLA